MMKMLTFDPQKRITAAQALKHPWFEGWTYNPAADAAAGLKGSGSNKNISSIENPTNTLGSGGAGRALGSRAMRIESRKGILSRKSSVNKNSFYKQKSKDVIPNKMYGQGSPGGIAGANRGPSSYFNKNGGPMGSSVAGSLPGVGSRGAPGLQKNSRGGYGMGLGAQPYKYPGGGIGGGGIGSSDPYSI